MKKMIVLVCFLSGCSLCYGGIIVADAVSEFSGVQGQDNWYYGYYSPADDVFNLMTNYSYISTYETDSWHANYATGGYWTTIAGAVMVPNGLNGNSGRLTELHWVVRRYISEVSGDISISGILKKYYSSKAYLGGDGLRGHIIVNGNEVWNGTIGGYDSTGIDYSINTTVNAGDIIDFAIDPGSNNSESYDHGYFTGTITLVPEPLSLSFGIFGGILAINRKRG